MKINIEGFKCDICGNEYLKNTKNTYNSEPTSFSIDIRSNKGGLSDVHNSAWGDVCYKCKDRIERFVNEMTMDARGG